MKIIIETDRLYLREFILTDGIHFFELNNDEEVLKFTGDEPFKSEVEATNFILNYNEYNKNGFGRWAVCLKETNEFLGWCGFKKDEKTSEIDLGFRFFKKYWGNGFAFEAAMACIDYGGKTLNMKCIVGRVYVENLASIHVLKKCKFNFSKNIKYDNRSALLFELNL